MSDIENLITEISKLSLSSSNDTTLSSNNDIMNELCDKFDRLTTKCTLEEKQKYFAQLKNIIDSLISKSRCFHKKNNTVLPNFIF